jgi:dihydropteroate synthase
MHVTPSDFERWLNDPNRRPLVMGVLNVTPDSFSDGGQYVDPSRAIAHGREMAAAGAAVIDVGGESTRPGSEPVAPDEQIRRIIPVIRGLAGQIPAIISVDTSWALVARAALDAGGHLVNDVFAGRDDPELLPLVAARRVPIILMHMQGRPATMQHNPSYTDVVAEVLQFLQDRSAAAQAAGIDRSRILIDPGIGFGKTVEHNLTLLRRISNFKSLDLPLVVGTSRKGFLGKIAGETPESGRPFGTAATVAWAVANGADLVRVHDVGPMAQVVRTIGAIQHGMGR